jgi:GGDEF domain-containing protein
VREAQEALIERYVQVQFGLFLTKHIRGTDVLAQQGRDGRFLLLAPDVPADQTAEMLARLARLVEDQMGVRFRYSIVDFPKTALTSEELLRKAAEALRYAAPDRGEGSDGVRLEPPVVGGADPYAAMPIGSEAGLEEHR